jgi:hypothetical protein
MQHNVVIHLSPYRGLPTLWWDIYGMLLRLQYASAFIRIDVLCPIPILTLPYVVRMWLIHP